LERQLPSRALDRQQFVENFSVLNTFGAGIAGATINAGTVFPLLARSAMRIYNVAATAQAAQPNLVNLSGLVIQLLLFSDVAGLVPIKNPIQLTVFGQAAIVLAAGNFANNEFVGGNSGAICCGKNVSNEGDPLFEIRANAMVSGIAQIVRSVQFQVIADWKNTDVANQSLLQTGYALIDFQV